MRDAAPFEVARGFSQTYAQARACFLAAAQRAGIEVHSHVLNAPGHDGEVLAMDVAREGATDARCLLVISSACHGVEGFCGAGIQVALLNDATWHAHAAAAGVAVLYVHALNPHGFSWWRRATQENVDLNRNFPDFSQPLPANPGYDELADLLVPAQWPPGLGNRLSVLGFVLRRGMRRLQTAVSTGQYAHPNGLFYGGNAPTWSHRTLHQVLHSQGDGAERLGWIDLHSGLGPNGVGERILACPAHAAPRARNWWGTQVTSIDDGSSVSAPLTGLMWTAALEECPQAEYTGIALEFGTVPMAQVIHAMRADQWLHNHPEAPAALRRAIRQQMRDAFYVDTDAWKQSVVAQATEAAHQALDGLSLGFVRN